MDEPLSNLDAKLRVQTRTQIAALQRRLGVTTVYVTHDQVEAMTMGDRVAVLKDGILQQCATPRELFTHPANTFVAGFIGSPAMNMLQCTTTPDGLSYADITLPLTAAQRSDLTSDQVTIGVRPESLRVSETGIASHDHGDRRAGLRLVRVCDTDQPTQPHTRRPNAWAQCISRRAKSSTSCPMSSGCTCSTRPVVPGSKADDCVRAV